MTDIKLMAIGLLIVAVFIVLDLQMLHILNKRINRIEEYLASSNGAE